MLQAVTDILQSLAIIALAVTTWLGLRRRS